MTDQSPLLAIRDLSIRVEAGNRTRTIVTGIDLDVGRGETVGIVGESGSGKSMTARAVLGLLPRGMTARGKVVYGGVDLMTMRPGPLNRLRGGEISLILQDPFTMLNPLIPAGRHIAETIAAGGKRYRADTLRQETLRRLRDMGIADPSVAARYPFQLSGGMRQRVAIAAAVARQCKLLIADEPSTALDVSTQKDVMLLLRRMQTEYGTAIILITHDLRVAFAMCDRIYVLYSGSLMEVGRSADIEAEPLHPYTLGLLLSEPVLDRRVRELATISGSVPAPDDVSGMCAFAARCRWASAQCETGKPILAAVGPNRLAACVRVPEIQHEMRAARVEALGAVAHSVSRGAARVIVRTDGLSVTFAGTGRARRLGGVRALNGVSIEVAEGESIGVVGESGSGKTTLARCLVGLERATEGMIGIDGIEAQHLSRLGRDERRRLRRTIQMVFQDPYSTLNPSRTVGSTLREAIVAGEGSGPRIESEIARLLELVGLPRKYAERKPVALSGGERQRVAIARALGVRPKVLVCDEPVSALDVSVQAQILNLVTSLRETLGMTCIFITHDLAVARQVADRLYVMHRGEIVEAGTADDLLTRPTHPYTMRLLESVPRAGVRWLSVPEDATANPAQPSGPPPAGAATGGR